MFQNVLIAITLVNIGYCMWVRRHSWHVRWERSITLAILLQGLTLALCIPINARYLGLWLFEWLGVGHLRDYIGHLCFLLSVGAIVHAAASRLVPDDQLGLFMLRIKIPIVIAAGVMLACVIAAPTLQQLPYPDDFFQIHRDHWLAAYQLTYMGTAAYLLRHLADLLFALRQDDRNRVTVDLYIAACRAGFVAVIIAIVDALSPGARIDSLWVWVPLCASSALAATAAALSWRRRERSPNAWI